MTKYYHNYYRNKQPARKSFFKSPVLWAVIGVVLITAAILFIGPENVMSRTAETFRWFIGSWQGTNDESTSSRANEIFTLTNEQRRENGLQEFKRVEALDKLAMDHAISMYKRGEVDHEGFKSKRSPIMMGMGYNITAENAANGYEASSFVQGWMDSTGHRENILNSHLTHIGIGVYGKYACQVFAGY